MLRWRRLTGPVATLPAERGVYDDIIASIRRQGFLDALGGDLLPSGHDNGEAYWASVTREEREEARLRASAASEMAWRASEAQRVAAWEAAIRQKNLERQRLGDVAWAAAERAKIEAEIEADYEKRAVARAARRAQRVA
jgi:hypothetical protein